MHLALAIFAGVILVLILARSTLVRDQFRHWRIAIDKWIDAIQSLIADY